MRCLSPPSYLTKRTARFANPCHHEALAMSRKSMRPYAAEGWQGAASTSLTAPYALWTAAEVFSVLCCLLLLRQQSSGILWVLGRVPTPQARP